MECKFSKCMYIDEGDIKFNDEEILKNKSSWYLGKIIHKDWEIEDDVNYRIRVLWMKWRNQKKKKNLW